MKKRISIFCLAILVTSCLVVSTVALESETAVSGMVGTFSWTLENGTITISGSGAMEDFSEEPPWQMYAQEIQKVVFADGVTYVAANAFSDYDSITEIDFGSAMYELGTRSFYSCDELTELYFPKTFRIFGEDSLRACTRLSEIHCEGQFPSFRLNSLWDTHAIIYYPADAPWSVDLIAQLEEAFHGRIEFIDSDGIDHYSPTEVTLPETESTQEASPVTTETETESTADTTTITEEPTIVQPTSKPEQPISNTDVTVLDDEQSLAGDAASEDIASHTYPTAVVVIAAIVMLLSGGGAITLIILNRRGGKYLH